MADEKLIEEAAKAMYGVRANRDEARESIDAPTANWYRRMAKKSLAVLEMRDRGHEALRDDVSEDEQIAVLSSAFQNVLCDFHTDDATFQETKERYLAEALAENKMIESLLPMFMEIAGMPAFTPSTPETPTEPAVSFQNQVANWTQTCFGGGISADCIERNHRFLEESLELVQSCGCSQSEAHQLVDYVFGRETGDKFQELGGVMVTLAALCNAQKLDMDEAKWAELKRAWTKIDKIRAKQAAKPKHSPLPQAAQPPAPTGQSATMDDEVRHAPTTEPSSIPFYSNILCAKCWGSLAKGCRWISGEGETPSEMAICEKCFQASQSKIRTSFIHPPIPVRAFDWVAWIDGEEESTRYGYGRTEQEAKDELSNVLVELNEAAQPPADGQLVEQMHNAYWHSSLGTTDMERMTAAMQVCLSSRNLALREDPEITPLCVDHAQVWYTIRPTIATKSGCIFCDLAEANEASRNPVALPDVEKAFRDTLASRKFPTDCYIADTFIRDMCALLKSEPAKQEPTPLERVEAVLNRIPWSVAAVRSQKEVAAEIVEELSEKGRAE